MERLAGNTFRRKRRESGKHRERGQEERRAMTADIVFVRAICTVHSVRGVLWYFRYLVMHNRVDRRPRQAAPSCCVRTLHLGRQRVGQRTRSILQLSLKLLRFRNPG